MGIPIRLFSGIWLLLAPVLTWGIVIDGTSSDWDEIEAAVVDPVGDPSRAAIGVAGGDDAYCFRTAGNHWIWTNPDSYPWIYVPNFNPPE